MDWAGEPRKDLAEASLRPVSEPAMCFNILVVQEPTLIVRWRLAAFPACYTPRAGNRPAPCGSRIQKGRSLGNPLQRKSCGVPLSDRLPRRT